MSKENQSDSNEELQKKGVNNNPCGICRAMGSPVCNKHGGGSGEGSSNSKDTKQQEDSGSMLSNPPTLKPKNDSLFYLLEQSPLWTQADEFVFQYKNPYGLLTMTLNMENNTVICQGMDDLTQAEQHALDMLYKAIERELNFFKKEFPTTHPMHANTSLIGNQMLIKISDPKCFDAFIQHLADKNLLVLTDKNLLQAQPNSVQMKIKVAEIEAPKSEQAASSYTSPTPFNMTPKPKE